MVEVDRDTLFAVGTVAALSGLWIVRKLQQLIDVTIAHTRTLQIHSRRIASILELTASLCPEREPEKPPPSAPLMPAVGDKGPLRAQMYTVIRGARDDAGR